MAKKAKQSKEETAAPAVDQVADHETATTEVATNPPKVVEEAPGAEQTSEYQNSQYGVNEPVHGKSKRAMWPVFTVLILVLLAGAGFVAFRQQTSRQTIDQDIVATVAQKAVVPADDRPTVSTVVNETQVNQPFLANARRGDKVLLYFKSGTAIVYRPETGQIVNMGPLETPKPRVFVRDGRQGAVPESLIASIAEGNDFIVVSRDSSPKQNYQETLVVDVAGNRPDVASRLAERIGARVAGLPAGESRPDADMLVIVGTSPR